MIYTKSFGSGFLVRYHSHIYHIPSDDIRLVIEEVLITERANQLV